MYILPNLIAVLGPLAICMLIHYMFHLMSYQLVTFLSRICDGVLYSNNYSYKLAVNSSYIAS